MRRFCVLLALLLCASTAQARTWYVSPSGTGAGYSAGDPASLWDANDGVVEGDYVFMASGYYSTAIRPTTAGSADLGKIHYIGTFMVGDTTIVSGIYCELPYISVSGVTCWSSINVTAAHDSLDNVHLPYHTLSVSAAGDYLYVRNSTFTTGTEYNTGQVMSIGTNTGGTDPPALTGVVLDSCQFTVRHTSASETAIRFSAINGITVFDCSFSVTVASTGDKGMVKMTNVRNGTWSDNTWTMTSERSLACDECNDFYLRDYTRNNRFLRNRFYWTGTYPFHFMPSASGAYSGTNRNNTFYECEFRAVAPAASPLLYFQNGMRSDSLAYCTVISPYTPALTTATCDSATIVHNTFMRLCPDTVSAYDTYTAVVAIDAATADPKFADNICYSKPHPDGGDSLYYKPGAAFVSGEVISGGEWDNGDYNLWYSTNGADSTIYVGGYSYSVANLCTDYTVECNSAYGDPLFVGGTPTISAALTFDARILDGSPAHGTGSGGSDIGALAYEAVDDSFTVEYFADSPGTINGIAYQRVAWDSCATVVEAEVDTSYHYTFAGWDDGNMSTQRLDCNIRRDTSYTASFVVDSVTVEYLTSGSGSVLPAASAYQRVAYGGDADSVCAVPATGYHFVRWLPDSSSNAVRDGVDTTCVADQEHTAVFAINTYLLTYTELLIGGRSHGELTGDNPQNIQHGADGTEVVAVPDEGYYWAGWSPTWPTAARTDTNVVASATIYYYFNLNQYTLTYTAGTGGTIVGTNPQSVYYLWNGTTVTATPSAGYAFYSWSDSLKTAARRDTLVTADLDVTAIFNSLWSSAPGCSLSSDDGYLYATKSFTIHSTGTEDLHVYDIALYHRDDGELREVSCTKSSEAQTIAADDSVTVTLSGVSPRWRGLPDYVLVVLSDDGTDLMELTYDPCR